MDDRVWDRLIGKGLRWVGSSDDLLKYHFAQVAKTILGQNSIVYKLPYMDVGSTKASNSDAPDAIIHR